MDLSYSRQMVHCSGLAQCPNGDCCWREKETGGWTELWVKWPFGHVNGELFVANLMQYSKENKNESKSISRSTASCQLCRFTLTSLNLGNLLQGKCPLLFFHWLKAQTLSPFHQLGVDLDFAANLPARHTKPDFEPQSLSFFSELLISEVQPSFQAAQVRVLSSESFLLSSDSFHIPHIFPIFWPPPLFLILSNVISVVIMYILLAFQYSHYIYQTKEEKTVNL